MAKVHTFPILFDETLQINISNFKRWGYLKPNQWKTGELNWSRNGNKTGSISIGVSTLEGNEYLHLKYNFRDEPREYKVKLFWKESNLNQGKVWFFICPKTFRYCRKLYSIDGYFLSRTAFKGLNCMYEKQTYSKYGRMLDKTFGAYFGTDKAYQQIYSKHFKKFYAGKPTKKYLRIMEQIQKAERLPHHEIERALIS